MSCIDLMRCELGHGNQGGCGSRHAVEARITMHVRDDARVFGSHGFNRNRQTHMAVGRFSIGSEGRLGCRVDSVKRDERASRIG